MTLVKVPAETEFIGVVTLRDPTKESAAIVKDALCSDSRGSVPALASGAGARRRLKATI